MNQCPHCHKQIFTQMMTIDEACKSFGFNSKGTLRKYIEKRIIPVIKIGRSVYIDPVEMQAWIDSQKTSSNKKMRLIQQK